MADIERGVEANPGEMEVICLEDSMELVLNKSGRIALSAEYLRLGDSNCTLYSNGTHLLSNMSLDACGTVMELMLLASNVLLLVCVSKDDGVDLIFTNEVVSFNESNAVIVRDPLVEIEFSCKYPKQSSVTLDFIGHRPPVNFTQRGFGTFTLQFEFFESSTFSLAKDPSTYPLEFDLGDMMYMQIQSFTSVPNTVLFAESCTATPSDDPNSASKYPIIKDGCKVDQTVQLYANGQQSEVQFAMEAFKFIGLHEQVFIRCSVILCKADTNSSRCSQGCTEGLRLPAGHISASSEHTIRKREAPFQTANHAILQGPLRLRRSVTKQVAVNMDPNIMLTIGAFVAAVAMACGVMLYRTWKSSVTYERMV
ncbi:ZP domain-containing protein-like [Clupea harengus]|uniref:ZP domain-containing protein-like n=1 Tax=Clupea harengus TaxID=7950 RepID=A0A8M1K5I2_CLUHA|nr:ZP domain-containing protein-like [Clupea harengus]